MRRRGRKPRGLPGRRGAARIAAAPVVFAAGPAVPTLADAQTTATATGVTSTTTNRPDHTLSVHIDSVWLDIPHRDVECFQVGLAAARTGKSR